MEVVPQVQLTDLPLHGIQVGQRSVHQAVKLCLLGNRGELCGIVYRCGCLIELCRRDSSPQPSMALIAGHGKQPRPQPVGVAQPRDPG